MKVVILGGGISGLSLAYFLQKKYGKSIQLTLFEKSHRVGGSIQTVRKGGFLFELGPHSIRGQGGEATSQLIQELNLQNEVVLPKATQRYLFSNNRLNPFRFSWGFFPAILKDLFAAKSTNSDETIYSFASRRFGSEIAERFFDPLTTGIYAGNIRELSIRSCFPQLHQWEQQKRSVILGFLSRRKKSQSLFSFRNGMETLTQALHRHLEPVIKLNTSIQSFNTDPLELIDNFGNSHYPDRVYCALPSYALAPLFEPHHPALANSLASIKYASLVVVNVGFKRSLLKKQGFGYLIPSKEGEDILGVLWDSSVFPQNHEETRLTFMLGGSHRPDIITLSSSEIANIVLKALVKHLDIHTSPDVLHIERIKHAVPQFLLGHSEKIHFIQQAIKNFSPHIHCFGSAFNGVSINDCISSALLSN